MVTETPFKARIHFADVSSPGRAYIHRAGLNEVFGSESANRNYFKQQYELYLKRILKNMISLLQFFGVLKVSK